MRRAESTSLRLPSVSDPSPSFPPRGNHCRGICILQPGPCRRPQLHDQGVHRDGGLARRDCPGTQDLVAEPLEKRMQELTYYDHVDTFTRPGLAFLTVTLKDYTPPNDVQEEFYQGRKKIQDEALRLPQGVLPPVLNDEYTDVTFSVYALEAPGLPLRTLTREAETLRQDLLHVPGVKKVNVFGERPERIFVQFSYDRIATLGVSERDIFDALVRQNAVTPSGSIDTQNQQVYIRLDGALNDLEKIRDTPIVSAGRTLKLSDIADVQRGYEDPANLSGPSQWPASDDAHRCNERAVQRVGVGEISGGRAKEDSGDSSGWDEL